MTATNSTLLALMSAAPVLAFACDNAIGAERKTWRRGHHTSTSGLAVTEKQYREWRDRNQWWREFCKAVQARESGNTPDPSEAVGDNGRSIGPYQIQLGYWLDSGVPGKYQDVRSAEKAEYVMFRYFARYCPAALKQADTWTMSRVHNGGPGGPRCALTVPYAKWIKSRLRR